MWRDNLSTLPISILKCDYLCNVLPIKALMEHSFTLIPLKERKTKVVLSFLCTHLTRNKCTKTERKEKKNAQRQNSPTFHNMTWQGNRIAIATSEKKTIQNEYFPTQKQILFSIIITSLSHCASKGQKMTKSCQGPRRRRYHTCKR